MSHICLKCNDTGSLSKLIDADLDCHYCDATMRRRALIDTAVKENWGHHLALKDALWAAYLFAQRQAAPVAAQPAEQEQNRYSPLRTLEVRTDGSMRLNTTFAGYVEFDGVNEWTFPATAKQLREFIQELMMQTKSIAAPQPAAQPSDDVALTDKQCAKIKAKAAKATDDWLESQPEENAQLKSDGIFIRHIAAAIKAAMAKEKA